MKALLDILNEEKYLVDQINRLDHYINRYREQRDTIRTSYPDCESKERDLERMIIEIDILENQKTGYQDQLQGVQHELAGYLSFLSDL
jgi:predicted  nucleic acid-binding Zn-ribbon protein